MLYEPQEMAGHKEVSPRAEAANHRPLPERSLRARAPGTSGPGSSTEGDSEAAPGARDRGELVGASDSENRGPLCGIQSHGRASSSAFGSEKRLSSRVSLCRRRRCPGGPDSKLAEAQLSARGWELHHQRLQ